MALKLFSNTIILHILFILFFFGLDMICGTRYIDKYFFSIPVFIIGGILIHVQNRVTRYRWQLTLVAFSLPVILGIGVSCLK